jgi:hypothetical protein
LILVAVYYRQTKDLSSCIVHKDTADYLVRLCVLKMPGDSARVWGCVPRRNRRITFSGIAGKCDTGEMSQHNAKEKGGR